MLINVFVARESAVSRTLTLRCKFSFRTFSSLWLKLMTLFSLRIFLSSRSHCVWLIVIFFFFCSSYLFLGPFVTGADYDSAGAFARLKMGQLPFLNDTSLSHCIWLTCLLPGNREKAGSCGGMIWYELKLFPNRLHRVWSCPPACLPDSLPQYQPGGEHVFRYFSSFSPLLSFCSSQ